MIETDVFEGFGLAIQKTHAAQHDVEFLPHCIRTHQPSLASTIDLLGFFPD
jgi:hypothetical protein